MSNKEDLPSINDYLEESGLPSYKDFIEEGKELPSVEEYKTYPLEEDQTIEDANGNTFAEVIDVVKAPEWQELVKLVNDVRKQIPEIPEIKSYDDEIGQISEKIAEIQENFSQYDLKSDKIYDLRAKNEEFEAKLTEIEQKIPEVPEIRYYEGDIELIYGKISRIKEEIESLPEVKYYENDLDTLKSRIEEVNDNIPTFPKWVNEVNEVPDFSWIGKTFGVIDDDFKKVESHFDLIKDTIDSRVSELVETIEVKDFEQKVDFKDFKNVYSESKDKIYKELKEITLRVYDHKHEFKDDDRKLKKAILGEQNKLKQTLETEIKRINKESVKTDETILSYFTNLKEEVSKKFDSLPEIKHYDSEIDSLKQDVKFVKVSVKSCLEDIKKISADIKKAQVDLTEGLLNEPPNERETAGGQTDPLTPLDQKFATLDDLSKHYRLFINRIQTQLSTMGGGGAGFIKDLDDVTFDGTNGQLLIYNSTTSKWVGIASTAIGGAADELAENTTGTNLVLSGNLSVAGIATYEDVKNIDSIGIITSRDDINIINDNKKLNIGASADLQLYHSVSGGGQTSFIDNNTGPLFIRNNVNDDDGGNIIIQAKSGKASAVFQDDEGVRLYYDNAEKFETISTGVNITGVISATTARIGSATTFSEDLVVQGDARVTGILTIGTASITLDPNAKKISGVDEIIVGTANTISIKQNNEGNITFEKQDGKEASVGIGTTVSINTTGIITAATLQASTAFFPPILTTAQRDALSVTEGAMIFNTTTKKMNFYDGTNWVELPGMTLGLTVALDG